MVRVSLGLQPDYAVDETLALVKAADELGFHGCYFADDPNSRDPWLLMAAAARETTRIRLGPSVTHVYLRDPTLLAQALATLDELSGGRAEAAVSFGDPFMLDTYHVDWRGRRPLARVREAIGVMRTLLDEGALTHEGEFFRYSGLATSARPVQHRLPLLVGAIGGPRSFRLAGEVADGVHAVGCSRANAEFVLANVKAGAEQAGRDWRGLDVCAVFLAAIGEDAAAAKEAARVMAGMWLASMPANVIERHGLDPEEVQRISDAMAGEEYDEALRRTTPAMGEAFAVAGRPGECAERIRADLVDAGIDHVALALADPVLVEVYSGTRLDGVPDLRGQLRLIHDRLLPRLADRVS